MVKSLIDKSSDCMACNSMFSVSLPLEDNMAENLQYLVNRIEGSATQTIHIARQSIVDFEEELFQEYAEICASGIESFLCSGQKIRKLRFVYCIDLMQKWQGDLILMDEAHILLSNRICGPVLIEKIQNDYSYEDFIKEYMLMKLMIDFNIHYIKKGRIFPAYIKLINQKSFNTEIIRESIVGDFYREAERMIDFG